MDFPGDSAMPKIQLNLDFECQKFDTLEEAFIHSLYSSPIALKHIAGELDLLPSGLSKRLNLHPDDTDPRFNLTHFEKYLKSTGDMRPLYYLVEKFLQVNKDKALHEFEIFKQHLPELKRLIALVEDQHNG